jgi:hypothetical protein
VDRQDSEGLGLSDDVTLRGLARSLDMTASRSTMPARLAAALLLAAGLHASAVSAPTEVSPTGFVVSLRHETSATPQGLYQALGRIEQWWNGSHSYSGKASNLSLPLQAGGCFCERWEQNSIEHARVVNAFENRLLRLSGALGPLQALAVEGVLSFAISEKDGRTTLEVTYRVAGPASAGLDRLAAPVDGVIAEQAKRLVSFAETGRPE